MRRMESQNTYQYMQNGSKGQWCFSVEERQIKIFFKKKMHLHLMKQCLRILKSTFHKLLKPKETQAMLLLLFKLQTFPF